MYVKSGGCSCSMNKHMCVVLSNRTGLGSRGFSAMAATITTIPFRDVGTMNATQHVCHKSLTQLLVYAQGVECGIVRNNRHKCINNVMTL